MSQRQNRRLTAAFWLIAIALGLLQAWTSRFHMNSDGISYMDMGDAFFRGNWQMAVNAYWSPLYSWLTGFAFHVLRPSSRAEFPVVHLVNFIVYVLTLASFTFFLNELVCYGKDEAPTLAESGQQGLPPWAWQLLGYILFLSTSLEWITLDVVTPDMCVAAFLFLASALVLRIRRRVRPRLSYALLGFVLGFGYLAKSPMFLLAFIFLGVTLIPAATRKHEAASGLIALATFLVVAIPWIVVLSRSKGRLTFSDTGRLAYAWYVDGPRKTFSGLTYRHWQGQPSGSGEARHPTRQILDDPAVFEFATPVGGTYPVWYDPSYWNEGLKVSFHLGRQMRTILRSLADLIERTLFPARGGFAIGLTILLVAGGGGRTIGRNVAARWFLLVPAIAAYFMYALVHVEARFVGPFFAVLALASYGAVRLPDCLQSRRLIAGVMVVIVALWFRSTAPWAARAAITTFREVVTGRDAEPCQACEVAEGLVKLGVHSEDTVASLKYSNGPNVGWARLAKARIVAEVYLPGGDYDFWTATPEARRRVVEALSRTTARVIVDDRVPTWAASEGWQRVENTSYGVLFLENTSADVWPTLR